MANADGIRFNFRKGVDVRFTKALETLEEAARGQCPIDSGTLAYSIAAKETDSTATRLTGVISTPKEYASWQDEGTGIYGPKGVPIRPVNAKVLAWQSKGPRSSSILAVSPSRPGRLPMGGWVFADEVAGTPPTRFWSDNVTEQKWLEALQSSYF